MGSQQDLFHEPSQVLTPSTDHLDPAIWVKRLVIWEDKEKVIRDIPLRRGLNIIWSPDPGSDDAVLGQSSGSGHGAGKTLFCRLIRYCLGEDRFANEELRHAIAQSLPQGLVGAEVMVGDTLWSIIRPLGATRKHWAITGQTLDEILAEDPASTGMEPLFEAVASHLIPSELESALPGSADHKGWLYALGWLSRDQECRFDHLLDWRHADADTDSPLRNLPKEDILLAVRLFLNLISGEEMKVRRQRDALPKEAKILQNIDHYDRTIERIAKELTDCLGVTPIAGATDPLGVSAFQSSATSKLTTIESNAPSTKQSDELIGKQKRLDQLIGQAALLKEKVRQAEARATIQGKNINSLNSEHGKLDGAALKAEFGDVCPICSVPIDNALAEGCGLSHKLVDVNKIEGDKSRVQGDIQNCINAKAIYEKQKSEHEATLSQVEGDILALRNEVETLLKKDRFVRDEYLGQRFAAQALIQKGQKLQSFLDEKTKQEKALIKRNTDNENLKGKLSKLREKHQSSMTRLNDFFTYAAQATLDTHTSSSIKLIGNRLVDSVSVGGSAMTSFKAIIFDIAALLLTLEGRTHLPAFLIHDSPREADLGISYYHKLFLFVRELEDLSPEPSFQYIITTTTKPPKSLVKSDCHIVTLDGSDPEQRLLKRDFTGLGA